MNLFCVKVPEGYVIFDRLGPWEEGVFVRVLPQKTEEYLRLRGDTSCNEDPISYTEVSIQDLAENEVSQGLGIPYRSLGNRDFLIHGKYVAYRGEHYVPFHSTLTLPQLFKLNELKDEFKLGACTTVEELLESFLHRVPTWDEPISCLQGNSLQEIAPKGHYIYRSYTSKGCLAYLDEERYVWKVLRVGKYLERFCKPFLEMFRVSVSVAANEICIAHGEHGFELAETEEDIEYVYVNGPHSCMSGADRYPDVHPTRAYASPDFAVAYTRNNCGIDSRAVVSKKCMSYSSIYGNSSKLERCLEVAGYNSLDSFVGHRLKKIKNSQGLYVCPYVDGKGLHVHEEDDEYLILSDEATDSLGLTHDMYETGGVLKSITRCEDCEEITSSIYTTDGEDRNICDSCIDQAYVWSAWEMTYLRASEAVRCARSDEYIRQSESVFVRDLGDVHESYASQALGENGNYRWYLTEDVLTCDLSGEDLVECDTVVSTEGEVSLPHIFLAHGYVLNQDVFEKEDSE